MKDIFFKMMASIPDTGATQQMVHDIMQYMEKSQLAIVGKYGESCKRYSRSKNISKLMEGSKSKGGNSAESR